MNKLINGDCVTELSKLMGNSVHLVVTSPPYDNLRNYNSSITWNADVWREVIRQLHRVTCRGGIVVWIVADATTNGSETGTSFQQALYFKEVGFNLHDTMIWKRRTTPQTGPRYEPGFEYMFVFSKGAPRVFNPLKCEARYQERARPKIYHRLANETEFTHQPLVSGSRFVRRDNVWDIPNRGHPKIAYQHPAIFPEALARDHIASWTKPNDIVLDPFLGSGTTVVVAKALGRRWIGIEKEHTYLAIARSRLASVRR